MSLTLTPSSVAKNSDLNLIVDLSKAQKVFENNGTRFMTMAKFKIKKSIFKVIFSGEVSSDGIMMSTFGEGKSAKSSYSFAFTFAEEEEKAAFEKFQELVIASAPDDYDSSSIIKDDEMMYLKLKTKDGKRFSNFSNIKLDPKKIHESSIFNGQKVTVTGEVSGWYNLEDKKCGVSFSITKLEFEVDEEITQTAKRVKV